MRVRAGKSEFRYLLQGGFTPFTRAISWPKCSCRYLYTPMAYGLPSAPVLPRGQAAMATFEHASTRADVMTRTSARR